MRVYLVRHGESEANARATYMAQHVPLSGRGVTQAKMLARRFLKLPVEVIFSSDYPRAQKTADAIQRVTRKKLIVSKLIREEKHPSEWNGKSAHDPDVIRIKAKIRKNCHNPQWHHSDEENFFDVRRRSKNFLRIIEKKGEDSIVVTHGITMRVLVGLMLFGNRFTSKVFESFRDGLLTRNTGITVCEFNGKRWQVLTWNDHAHLS